MRLKYLYVAISILLFLTAASTNPADNTLSGISSAVVVEDVCASNCLKSVLPIHQEIFELKEQIGNGGKACVEKDNEIQELKHKFLAENRDFHERAFKVLEKNKAITIDFINNSDLVKNLKARIEDLEGQVESRLRIERELKKQILLLKSKEKNLHRVIRNSEDVILKIEKESVNKDIALEALNKNLSKCHKDLENSSYKTVQLVEQPVKPSSCLNLTTGIHEIQVSEKNSFQLFCLDGYIVVFKFMPGGISQFNESWTSYRDGFGSPEGNYFIGLEKLHHITNSHDFELFSARSLPTDMLNYSISSRIGSKYFKIGAESEGYNIMGLDNGSAQCKFSTYDQDNNGCAKRVGPGWFWTDCIGIFPGIYTHSSDNSHFLLLQKS